MKNYDLDKQLNKALLDVSIAEKKHRVRIIIIGMILIIFAFFLIYFTYNRVTKYSNEAEILRLKSEALSDTVKSLNEKVDNLTATLTSLGAFTEFSIKWDSTDVSAKTQDQYNEAIKAHKELLRLANTEKLNPNHYIRYYVKYQDQYPKYWKIKEQYKRNRVQNTLRRAGYRSIDVNTGSYRNSIATNIISYSSDVSKLDLKVIALALLRAGIELKEINQLPKKVARRKPNSIEIASDKSLINQRTLTVQEIIDAKY